MTLFWKAEWMSHGSELPKVTSVYLETAEPIDWELNNESVRNDFASHRIYIVQAVAACAWGNFRRR